MLQNPIVVSSHLNPKPNYLSSVLALLALLVCIVGCGAEAVSAEPSTPDVKTFDILIEKTDSGFKATLPDGRVYTDPGIFRTELPRLSADAALEGLEPRYLFGKSISSELDKMFGGTTVSGKSGDTGSLSSALTLNVGSYTLSDSYGTSRVDGCVSREVRNYTVYLSNRFTGTRYQAYHFAAWAQYGHPCLGVYESIVRLANSCTCDQDEPSIFYDGLRTSFVKAGASSLTATILASVIATMAHTALLVV